MNIEGRTIRLRAVEPGDVDLMYEWENDCDIWPVSGTTEPFSRHQLERFVERHQDIVGVLCDGQLRLIIETLLSSKPVGAIDLFEYDPIHRRAGIGILIYEQSDRGRGYASDAVETLCRYAHDTLRAHQLWCNVGADNEASLRLFLSRPSSRHRFPRPFLHMRRQTSAPTVESSSRRTLSSARSAASLLSEIH